MKTERKDVVETVPETRRDLTPFEDMDRLFNRLFQRGWLRPFEELWSEGSPFAETPEMRLPRIDVIDREQEILVRAELPGVERKDINIELTGQMLTIEGEHRHEKKEEKGEFYRAEIREGSFSRRIRLPDEVDEKGVKAEFTNGVLEVHMPKTHKVERHKIEVK